MNILTICYGLGIGGAERAAQDFTLGYQAAGHKVAFLNYGVTGPREALLKEMNVPVFSANGNLSDAVVAAKAFVPDIIHIHRRGRRNDLETAILEEFNNKNCRVLEQNIFGEADYSKGADLIDVHLHLSEWCLWRWRRFLGSDCRNSTAVVIGNPVDGNKFYRADSGRIKHYLSALGIEEGAYVCGRVGQPLAGKWHPSLISAFSSLADYVPSAYLLLIGIPSEIEAAIHALPSAVRERIRIMPMTGDDAELRTFYSSVDCFIHAAQQGESFGLVLTEAMLCGCPVVTVNQPHVDNSQVEVVGHLRGGIVAGSIQDLDGAVRMMHDDRELRDRLAINCRDSVLGRFELSEMVRKVLKVAEIALSTADRHSMRCVLSEDTTLKADVSDDEIKVLYENVLGCASAKELMLMNIYHNKYFNRLKSGARRFIRKEQ